MRRILTTIIGAIFLAGWSVPGLAQEPSAPEELRIGISPFPPFVIEKDEAEGYSIDLWKEIANEIDRPFRFVKCVGAADKLRRLQPNPPNGAEALDVAIGGITTSSEREKLVDFTHPTYRSGLGIMLPGPAETPGLFERIQGALAKTNTGVIWGFFILVLVAGHAIWLLERGESFAASYVPGVFEGIYWAIVTASTVGYGDKAPVKPVGRILAMLVIVVSLPLFALFTAELASAFTLQGIAAAIDGPEDLGGRRVGVVRGTQSASFAAEWNLDIRQWDTAAEVYEGLARKEVSAVIYDAPSLKYHAQTADVHVIEREFDIRDLAMATPQQSPLREQINRALLALKASGKLTELRSNGSGRTDRRNLPDGAHPAVSAGRIAPAIAHPTAQNLQVASERLTFGLSGLAEICIPFARVFGETRRVFGDSAGGPTTSPRRRRPATDRLDLAGGRFDVFVGATDGPLHLRYVRDVRPTTSGRSERSPRCGQTPVGGIDRGRRRTNG